MYRVIVAFADLQDNKHAYKAGDEFPRSGVEVSDERIAELASNKNLMKQPLIQDEIEQKKVERKRKK